MFIKMYSRKHEALFEITNSQKTINSTQKLFLACFIDKGPGEQGLFKNVVKTN